MSHLEPSMHGSKHEIWPESDEQLFQGDLLPNGNAIFLAVFLPSLQSDIQTLLSY